MEQDRLAVESVVCSGRLPPGPEKENSGRGASEWNPKRRRAGRGRTGDRETEFNVPLQWVTRGCNCRSGRNRAGIAVMGVVRWLHRVDTDISATSDEAAPLSRFSAHRTAPISVLAARESIDTDRVQFENYPIDWFSLSILGTRAIVLALLDFHDSE